MNNFRKRQLLILGSGLAFLLICFWGSRLTDRRDHPTGDRTLQTNNHEINSQATRISPSANTTHFVSAASNAETARIQRLQTVIEEKNVSINFWGKIVDESDTPLDGVVVRAHVRTWVATAAGLSAFPKLTAVSSTDGRFEIIGAKGDVLTIESLEKDGYESEPAALRSFGYNTSKNIVARPDTPIVFKMWKAGIKQPLLTGSQFFKVIPDGRHHTIDLLNRTIAESLDAEGDLSVWIRRTQEFGSGQRYDWSFSIEAINGGLIEETDNYSSMYLAPENGYTNNYQGKYVGSAEGWSDGISGKRFYARTRNGKFYGRFEIEVYSSYGTSSQGRVWIKYAINPTGSCVLR